MPLDSHHHLVKQGWSGKGTGLRNGAIAKPITVKQKKTLAGIGKDRDEAFPFWDHVFQAAAVSIQLKLHKDSDEESNSESDREGSQTPAVELKRTATGIISNRRPLSGTPALSGATTPSDSQAGSSSGDATPQLGLMAAAKQQAARRMLYAMFYRGPVLATDEEESKEKTPSAEEGTSAQPGCSTASSSASEGKEHKKSKKRKLDHDEEKPERKRRKREAKEKEGKKSKKAKGKEKAVETSEDTESGSGSEDEESRAARKAAKAERKRRKAEKRARKEEKRKRKAERKASSRDKPDGANEEEGAAADTIPMTVDDGTDTQGMGAAKEERARWEKEKALTSDPSTPQKKAKKKAKP
ncbi:hypothetical protein OH77DRAFT_1428362 [Trametes cingulata]|nr:hypothetical protein OH77DRAFT_1428362 [Trametes cingulata]